MPAYRVRCEYELEAADKLAAVMRAAALANEPSSGGWRGDLRVEALGDPASDGTPSVSPVVVICHGGWGPRGLGGHARWDLPALIMRPGGLATPVSRGTTQCSRLSGPCLGCLHIRRVSREDLMTVGRSHSNPLPRWRRPPAARRCPSPPPRAP